MLKNTLYFLIAVVCLVNFESECQKVPLKKPFFKWLFSKFEQEKDSNVFRIVLSNDGTKLAAISGYRQPQLYIWDLPEHKEIVSEKVSKGIMSALAFSPDNKKLATIDINGLVQIFNVFDGKLLLKIATNNHNLLSKKLLIFTPCSNKILLRNRNAIDIFDVNNGNMIHSLKGHTSWIESLAFNKSGSLLVTAAKEDSSVFIWDMQTGKLKFTLSSECKGFNSVVFSHDEQYIAAGSKDIAIHEVYIWNINTGLPVHILNGHGSDIQSVVFSPDDSKLASGSSDATIRIWDVTSGKELAKLQHPGIAETMREVFFSNQGNTLISLHGKLIHIWDIKTGEKIILGKLGSQNFFSLDVQNDTIAASGGEEAVWIWNLNSLDMDLL